MAARGRPRKPVADLMLEGRFRSDRHGEVSATWQPDGVPTQPTWLSEDAAQLWADLVPPLIARGIATAVDAPELASLCDWWSRYRQASRLLDDNGANSGDPAYYRHFLQASTAWKNFTAVAARFGLNPSDRAKLRIESSGEAADPLLSFASEQRDVNGRGYKTLDT
jgi:P27 family predicted phage terminase small subunit